MFAMSQMGPIGKDQDKGDSWRELVKLLEYRSRTMFSLSRSTNSIKINKIELNSGKLDCRRSND